jgi:hypothetical protein
LPGSIVFAAKPHSITSNPSPIHMRARDPGAKFILPIPGASNLWCTGEDSNLRSSKERQIYSLLPLTARPPVHNSKSHCRTPQTLSRADQHKRGQDSRCGMIAAGHSGLKLWSWRRDLNPRPSDYKSDALPAELRQPEQPCSLPHRAGSQLPRLSQISAQLRDQPAARRML